MYDNKLIVGVGYFQRRIVARAYVHYLHYLLFGGAAAVRRHNQVRFGAYVGLVRGVGEHGRCMVHYWREKGMFFPSCFFFFPPCNGHPSTKAGD